MQQWVVQKKDGTFIAGWPLLETDFAAFAKRHFLSEAFTAARKIGGRVLSFSDAIRGGFSAEELRDSDQFLATSASWY